jgi:hypothetical protein
MKTRNTSRYLCKSLGGSLTVSEIRSWHPPCGGQSLGKLWSDGRFSLSPSSVLQYMAAMLVILGVVYQRLAGDWRENHMTEWAFNHFQLSSTIHDQLDSLPFILNDSPLVQPIRQRVCIVEVFWWLLATSIRNTIELLVVLLCPLFSNFFNLVCNPAEQFILNKGCQ